MAVPTDSPGHAIAEVLEPASRGAVVIAFTRSDASTLDLLSAVLVALPTSDRPRWHHVALHGQNPFQSFQHGGVLFVLGLEDIEVHERRGVLRELNLGRDRIREDRVRMVLVLPHSEKATFYAICPDLLAWRDLLLDWPDALDSGEERSIVRPPWPLVRDLAARRAVAVVGPWLNPDEDIRVLLRRLPWAGVVDLGPKGPPRIGEPQDWRIHDHFSPSSLDEDPAAFYTWVGMPDSIQWWKNDLALFVIGNPTLPDLGESTEHRFLTPPNPPRLRNLLTALVLAVANPAPPPRSWNTDIRPAAETPRRWGTILLGEPAAGSWYGGTNVWEENVGPPVPRFRGRARGMETQRREREAFALGTRAFSDVHARLLSGPVRFVVVVGDDLWSEATLTALGLPHRVATCDTDLEEEATGDLLVLRLWGDPLRPRTLMPGRTDPRDSWYEFMNEPDPRTEGRKALASHLSRNPRFRAILDEALARPLAAFGCDPDDLGLDEVRKRLLPSGGPRLVFFTRAPGPVEPLFQSDGFTVLDKGDPVPGTLAWLTRHCAHATPGLALAPPLVEPESLPEAARADLWNALSLSHLSHESDSFFAALEEGSFRLVGPPRTGRSLAVEMLVWSIQSGRRGWLGDRAQGFTSADKVDSHQGRNALESILTAQRPPVGVHLVVVDNFQDVHDLERSEWDRDLKRLAADCRLVVLDHPDRSWNLEAVLPTRESPGRETFPDAWYSAIFAENRAVLAALHTLRRRALHGTRPADRLLRNPRTALELLGERDPFDPNGPVLSLRLAAIAPSLVENDETRILSRYSKREAEDLGQEVAKLWGRISAGESWDVVAPLLALLRARPVSLSLASDILQAVESRNPPLGQDPRAWIQAEVQIPAGEHTFASEDSHPDVIIRKRYSLRAFSIDLLPVTRARYRVFVEAGGYTRQDLWTPEGWTWRTREDVQPPELSAEEDPAWPMTGISWFEAAAFARWLGRMLPTEAQWEAAARRGSPASATPSPRPVGSGFEEGKALPLEMGGLLFEWCSDWYSPRYREEAAHRDPQGPASGTERCAGGPAAWVQDDHSSRRWHFPPDLRRDDIGFRTARPDEED